MNSVQTLVVVPAHNEEATIAETIASIRMSIAACGPETVDALIVVVCDSCEDGTYDEAQKALVACYALVLRVGFRNVGKSRDWGVRIGLKSMPKAQWVASTDADSMVLKDWMERQLEAYRSGYDAFFGRVQFDDSNEVLLQFRLNYQTQDHRYIHGANMGLSLHAYRAVGGIPLLPAHEDKCLVDKLEEQGLSVFWDTVEAVQTSVRLVGRAPEGFAATLASFAQCFIG